METKERINLALEIAGYKRLVEQGIEVKTDIKEICVRYGVSRTTGYEVLAKLEHNIKGIFNPQNPGPGSTSNNSIDLLRISRETLRFLLKNVGEIHEGKYTTYSERLKGWIIRQMRETKEEYGINYEDFIEACGFNYATVMRWNTEYEENMKRKKTLPDLRGKRLSLASSTVEGIIEAWDNYKGRKITGFCKWYNQTHPALSRDVITEVLIGGGRYRSRRKRRDNTPAAEVKRYYPNAQWSWDGKEIEMVFNGNVYKFNLEAVIDLFSTSILSLKVGEGEDEEAVCSALKGAIDREKSPIAGLFDNGKANLSDRVTGLLEDEEIEGIPAYPYRPETKGDIEGVFGHLEKTLGRIEISGGSEQETARSVLEMILKVYRRLRNRSAKKVLDGKTPDEVLKNHPIREEERENARESLLAQAKRSREIRERPKINKEKEWLINRAVQRHNLCCEELLAQRVLRPYDYIAIERADNDFYVYSERDSFDENKRNLPYFRGIVRNIQEEIDHERLESYLREKYFDREKWRAEQLEMERREEEKKREERLRKEPEKVLLRWVECAMNLPDEMRVLPVEEGIREAVKTIFAHKKRPHQVLRRVFDDIGCDLRYGMAKRRKGVNRVKEIVLEIEKKLAR